MQPQRGERGVVVPDMGYLHIAHVRHAIVDEFKQDPGNLQPIVLRNYRTFLHEIPTRYHLVKGEIRVEPPDTAVVVRVGHRVFVHPINEAFVKLRVDVFSRQPVQQPPLSNPAPEACVFAPTQRLLRGLHLRIDVGLVFKVWNPQSFRAEPDVEKRPGRKRLFTIQRLREPADRRPDAFQVAAEQPHGVLAVPPRVVDGLNEIPTLPRIHVIRRGIVVSVETKYHAVRIHVPQQKQMPVRRRCRVRIRYHGEVRAGKIPNPGLQLGSQFPVARILGTDDRRLGFAAFHQHRVRVAFLGPLRFPNGLFLIRHGFVLSYSPFFHGRAGSSKSAANRAWCSVPEIDCLNSAAESRGSQGA